jgi:hypothetical protein
MSEAKPLDNDLKSPEAIVPLPARDNSANAQMPVECGETDISSSDWETVDFPGAMSVDAIPHTPDPQREVLVTSTREMEAPVEIAIGEQVQQKLQQENGELRDRITQLEQDLAQAQIELQLATAQLSQETRKTVIQQHPQFVQQTQELAVAQENINRLFQELELSHQTSQRQQILVETLTEQLESSQERVAQLERECALTQQRYNEQWQQLLQMENTCRDLQMRLHRQQQQALQFKVALEKSLDMSGNQRNTLAFATPPLETSPTVADGADPEAPSPTQLFNLQNQPVRPWTASEQSESVEAEISDSLTRLIGMNAEYGQPVADCTPGSPPTHFDVSADSTEDISALMEQLFADAGTTSTSLPMEAQQPAGIFDLGPFLEAGELSSEIVLPRETESQDASPPETLPVTAIDPELVQFQQESSQSPEPEQPQTDDKLWDELAQVIHLASKGSSTSANKRGQGGDRSITDRQTSQAPTNPASINPDNQTKPGQKNLSAIAGCDRRLNLLPISLRSSDLRQQFASHSANQRASQSDAVPSASSGSVASTQPLVDKPTDSQDALVAMSWPSPVVYPLRPSRKLESMSAVQLPSFRQARD